MVANVTVAGAIAAGATVVGAIAALVVTTAVDVAASCRFIVG